MQDIPLYHHWEEVDSMITWKMLIVGILGLVTTYLTSLFGLA
jgi:hypothetical protein